MPLLDGLNQISSTLAAGEQAATATLTGLSSLNNPRDPSGIARSPRPYVVLNGVKLPEKAVKSIEVTNASHFTADTFHLELAVSGLPAAYGPAYWADSQSDRISIGVSMAGETPTPLIVGQVDDVDWNLFGTTITLTGRDLSARLIDSKTAEKFQNQTSSEIAEALAQRHELAASVQPTATLAGTYYEIDHAITTHEETEWDLLTYLAQKEGFDVWVSGTTLYFQPSLKLPQAANSPAPLPWQTGASAELPWRANPQPSPTASAPPYVLLASINADGSFASNAEQINLRRSQTLARDVIVKVRSWNQKQQRAFTVTAKRSQTKKSQRVGGEAQTYSFVRPNLTQDQAQKLAESLAEDITRHERVLTASLPGDNQLVTRCMVRLAGTNTAWDQLYYPDTVTRRLSMDEGYRMDLKAKNHSTQDLLLA